MKFFYGLTCYFYEPTSFAHHRLCFFQNMNLSNSSILSGHLFKSVRQDHIITRSIAHFTFHFSNNYLTISIISHCLQLVSVFTINLQLLLMPLLAQPTCQVHFWIIHLCCSYINFHYDIDHCQAKCCHYLAGLLGLWKGLFINILR